ncbi:MAG: histidine phosphatase family protein [Verrucomicrobia bacterium]|nr:histidine phosphatase family protein [Verrucomicrobiota bacterium]
MSSFFSFVVSLAVLVLIPGPVFGQTNTTTVTPAPVNADAETIVAIRHGEKPPGGLGNLSCRGLNRALALPSVLLKYGTPAFIFAPNPAEQVDNGKYYVRPLVTIEPTAIRCQLPVNTAYGYKEIDQLAGELKKPAYQHALVFVAWEHRLLDQFARQMVKFYGLDPAQVPPWPQDDYDTIFVFKITHHQFGKDTLLFTVDHEGLNDLSDNCP